MQTDYRNMTLAALIDLLAEETQKFTQLMADKNYGLPYEECKNVIQQVQAAIKLKQDDETSRSPMSNRKQNFLSPDIRMGSN